jgi:hypothetical protein
MSFRCGRRASVEAFPMSWAFPTAEYYARDDSLAASGGLSLSRYSAACLSSFPLRRSGSSMVPSPGFPFRASVAVYHTALLPTRRSLEGLPSSSTPLFLHATACGLRRTFPSLPTRMFLCGLRCALKPSASATSVLEAVPALQGTRLLLRPAGYSVYASSILFTVAPRPRHGRKTRSGWVASPYPTGTFTR